MPLKNIPKKEKKTKSLGAKRKRQDEEITIESIILTIIKQIDLIYSENKTAKLEFEKVIEIKGPNSKIISDYLVLVKYTDNHNISEIPMTDIKTPIQFATVFAMISEQENKDIFIHCIQSWFLHFYSYDFLKSLKLKSIGEEKGENPLTKYIPNPFNLKTQ
jgi:1-deoxy-D-xylulose 5-phosphate reductoisomerase